MIAVATNTYEANAARIAKRRETTLSTYPARDSVAFDAPAKVLAGTHAARDVDLLRNAG